MWQRKEKLIINTRPKSRAKWLHFFHALAGEPNRSALFKSFSSVTGAGALSVWLSPMLDKTSLFFIFLFATAGASTTPNLSCLFLIFSSNSAFFMAFDDDWPNLSARFFKVSKSAEGAAPILFEAPPEARPNLSARACF